MSVTQIERQHYIAVIEQRREALLTELESLGPDAEIRRRRLTEQLAKLDDRIESLTPKNKET